MSEQEHKDGVEVLTGPVIGKTTESSTRILLEVNTEVDVTCVLFDESAGVWKKQTKHLHGRIPTVFYFQDLSPSTTYSVSFEGISGEVSGRVRTFGADQTEFSVVAAACDKVGARGKTNMWKKLWDERVEKGDVDVMIRHGDQVYADQAFKDAVKLVKKQKGYEKDEPLSDELNSQIVELYREIYRTTWSLEYCAKVISHCPQLMLWDDHEVRNDWGTFKQDNNPESLDYKIALCARQAYWEYQRQLWDEDVPSVDTSSGSEGHIHRWGPLGIVFVDIRGPRSFGYVDSDPDTYIGRVQMNEIETALHHGLLQDAKAVIAVHSSPAVYMSSGVSQCLSCFPCMVDKVSFPTLPICI